MPPSFASPEGSPLIEYSGSSTYKALCHVPRSSTTSQPYPCLIHLHGAGEAGQRVWEIIAEGQTGTPPVELHFGRAPQVLAERFIVVAPQSPRSRWSTEGILSFVSELLANPPVGASFDRSRIYISGHSNGASGALEAAAMGMHGQRPERFAACIPVAPGGCSRAVGHLAQTPVWIFHGTNDIVLPIRCADEVYSVLRDAHDGDEVDASRLRYTQIQDCPAPPGYPSCVGHGTPVVAWATEGIFEWLLSHHVDA